MANGATPKRRKNAWNSEVIALARCMFPEHPNARLWHERAIVYMINSFSTRADHADGSMVDGKRVNDWVTTTNIHPDFTLENHDRVHPDYLSTFSLNLRQRDLLQASRAENARRYFSPCVGLLPRLRAPDRHEREFVLCERPGLVAAPA